MTDIVKNEDIKKILEYIANKYINKNSKQEDFLFKELYDIEGEDAMTAMTKRIMFEELKGTTEDTKLSNIESSYIQTLLIYNNIIYYISNIIIVFINDNIGTYKRILASLNILKIIGQEEHASSNYLLEDDILTIYCPISLIPSNIAEIVIDFRNPVLKIINTENIIFNNDYTRAGLIHNLIYNNIITMFINGNEQFIMNNFIKKIFSNFVINYVYSSYISYKLASDEYINDDTDMALDTYSEKISSINAKIDTYNANYFNFSRLNHEDNIYIDRANVKLIDNFIILDNILDIDDNKFNLINNKIYDENLLNYHIIINNIQFDIEKANIDNNNNLINIELINTTNNSNIRDNSELKNILLRKRNINTIRDSYKTIGTKINISNENIIESQKKIKNLEKIYNTKKKLMRDIDVRYYINIAVYSIISIVYIYTHLFLSDRSLKINISLLILLIIIILLIANYLLRIKSTERFSVETTPGNIYINSDGSSSGYRPSTTYSDYLSIIARNILQPETNSSISSGQEDVSKNGIIKGKKINLDVSILSFLNSAKYYLDNIDNIEIYSILYSSLISENTKFNKYSNEYKNKKISNEGTIEIIKQDIIKKSAFIVMFSIFFITFAISYIIYLIYPGSLKLLFIISGSIFLVNLAYFIIIIKEPVRTKSINNYWTKPPSDTLTKSNQ